MMQGLHTADPLTVSTFQALVDAIVPNTPELVEFGRHQVAGAKEHKVYEYLIYALDHTLALMTDIGLTVYPLSSATAMLLNAGAAQYIASRQNPADLELPAEPTSLFASLTPRERIETLAMLEKLNFDLAIVPPPYRLDGGLVKFVIDYLNRATMFGHYSEWSSYGTTRSARPDMQEPETFPAGWKQAGYPGVSLGYRSLRGYLATLKHSGGEFDDEDE